MSHYMLKLSSQLSPYRTYTAPAPSARTVQAMQLTAVKPGKSGPAAGLSSGRLLGSGIMPTANRGDDCVGTPTSATVRQNRMMGLEHRVHNRPGGLNRILPGEERPVAGQGVAQESLIG